VGLERKMIGPTSQRRWIMSGEPKGVQEVMDHLNSAVEDVNRILGLQRTRGQNGAEEPRAAGLSSVSNACSSYSVGCDGGGGGGTIPR
jgi:hypothetical protein